MEKVVGRCLDVGVRGTWGRACRWWVEGSSNSSL